jgi:hypothetical protein
VGKHFLTRLHLAVDVQAAGRHPRMQRYDQNTQELQDAFRVWYSGITDF